MTGRDTAEFVITDGGCWIRAGGRDVPFLGVPDRGWNPARYLGDDMVLAGVAELKPTTIADAVEDLVTAGLEVLGRSSRLIRSIVFVHPSHWGVIRTQQLRNLVHHLGYSVTCTPFAAAVSRRQANTGVTLVLECGELATCATVVSGDGSILECRFEAALSLEDEPARFASLMNRPGIDRVIVTGGPGAELEAIAEQSAPPAKVIADARGLVTERQGTTTFADRLAAVPRGAWLVIGALVAAVAIAGAAALLYRPGAGPVTIAFGDIKVFIPENWSWTESEALDSRQERIDVVPQEGDDLRIVVLQNPVPPSTTLEEAMRSLDRAIAGKGARIVSPLETVVFAGRQTIAYTEDLGENSEVRWYTMLDRGVQASVGCQSLPGEWAQVAAACAKVVASIQVAN